MFGTNIHTMVDAPSPGYLRKVALKRLLDSMDSSDEDLQPLTPEAKAAAVQPTHQRPARWWSAVLYMYM